MELEVNLWVGLKIALVILFKKIGTKWQCNQETQKRKFYRTPRYNSLGTIADEFNNLRSQIVSSSWVSQNAIPSRQHLGCINYLGELIGKQEHSKKQIGFKRNNGCLNNLLLL